MKKNYRELAKRFEITIFADPDDPNWFCARVPDIPTIFTGGPNPTAALQQAQEAIEGYLTICEEDSLPICKPKPAYTEEITVRLPRDVHRHLLRRAERQGRSIQEVISEILEQELHNQHTSSRRRTVHSNRL
uniref:HicB family protein n=1 Tax=uncultured Acetothermia bacterium TaxID=236499 RepID=H5SH35_9BACT|nr:HicB family protein [uncultured Acetothermia bacterium]